MQTTSFKNYGTIVKFFSILLFIISCKDGDEENEPVPDPTSCQLSKAVESGATFELSYNSEGLPIQIKYDYSGNYEDIISLIEFDEHDNIIRMSQDYGYVEYGYDINDKVVSGKIYYRLDLDKSFTQIGGLRYTYNSEGLMDSTISNESSYERYEYDSRGYLIKTFLKDGPTENLIRENLKFDEHRVPAAFHFDHYTILAGSNLVIPSLKLPVPGPHNIEETTVRTYGGQNITYSHSFVYNELQYPATMTTTASDPSSFVESVTTFVYNCK